MKVRVDQLVEGCITKESIYSRSTKPIVHKNIELNKEHIKFLHAFLIDFVEVKENLSDGTVFTPLASAEEIKEIDKKRQDFKRVYLAAVKDYKDLFTSWMNGSKIQIEDIENIIYPLFEKCLGVNELAYNLHSILPREDNLYQKHISTALLAGCLAHKMGEDLINCFKICLISILSEIGLTKLVGIPIDNVHALNENELKEYQKHVMFSFQMLTNLKNIDDSIKMSVLQHEEKFDGSGYPVGLSGNKIQMFARYISVAQYYYDQLYYFSELNIIDVIEDIKVHKFGEFDLNIAKSLTTTVCSQVVGSIVKLNNNKIGEVVYIDTNLPSNLIVKTLDDEMIQLGKNRDIRITEVL